MLSVLYQSTATPTEVARSIGISPNKAHYHLGVLFKAGLVELVKTRTLGSITERYYRAVAGSFVVQPESIQADATRQLAVLAGKELEELLKDLQRLAGDWDAAVEQYQAVFSILRLETTERYLPDFNAALLQLQERFASAMKKNPGGRYRTVLALVPMDLTPHEGEDHDWASHSSIL